MTNSTSRTPRITHSMLCDSLRAVVVEEVEQLPTGQARVICRCSSCGRTDELNTSTTAERNV